MGKVLLVGFGGFIGSALRYAAGVWVHRLKAGWSFPIETLLINVAGCLLIGFLAGWSEARGAFAESTRAFVFIGLLGGFTTYSAFGHETFQLLRGGRWQEATTSVALQLVLGIGAVCMGNALAQRT